ncbi:MAG: hypothetical protein AAF399_15940 [Bacteroidota bacterium]
MKPLPSFLRHASLPSLIGCLLLSAFQPVSPPKRVENGYLRVEAEAYQRQEKDSLRRWYQVDADHSPSELADPDSSHASSASGGAYLEILPDTRTTHDDALIKGENFINSPGAMAILHYEVEVPAPGRYFIWVRAFSTGTEDNGIHVGLDGAWPESGQRMQWCAGKHQWTWESKQRTQEQHCGVERLIYLDIEEAGTHTISFSMREDGFEFDAWVMEQAYVRPE